MILVLIALVSVVALSIWGVKSSRAFCFFGEFCCGMFGVFGFLGLLVYAGMGFAYMAAEYEANIVNREYGTNYTQAEMFYASGVIETVRELDRKRVEVNGDLFGNESIK